MEVFYQDNHHIIEAEFDEIKILFQFIINNIRKNSNK